MIIRNGENKKIIVHNCIYELNYRTSMEFSASSFLGLIHIFVPSFHRKENWPEKEATSKIGKIGKSTIGRFYNYNFIIVKIVISLY